MVTPGAVRLQQSHVRRVKDSRQFAPPLRG
jgi:hypothetical protein